jgi:tetratricopeptide (TPR) repeat protein
VHPALNPNFAEAYNNRGIAYEKKGLPGRAIEDYDRAIALNPNLAEAYATRGLTHEQLGSAEADYLARFGWHVQKRSRHSVN